MQQMIFITDIIACSTCFGHHYAHHQELKSIIQVVAACAFIFKGYVSGLGAAAAARKPDAQPSAPHNTDNLKTKAPNTTGSNHLYKLLMMGIVVPEICLASNNICNKNRLLHLFSHINDDAGQNHIKKYVCFITCS
jgi:hypothetical protein